MPLAPDSFARHAFHLTTLIVAVLGAATAASADDDPILPYLDEGTSIVARLDVDRVDPAQLERFMNDAADTIIKRGKIPADQHARIKQEAAEAVGKAKAWLTDMQAAGAKRVYGMFLNSEDLLRRDDDPYFIVPLADGADADRIGELMEGGLGGRSQKETIGKAFVWGKQPHLERVRTQSQSGAPARSIDPADLAAAFAGKGGTDAPLRIAAVPGETTRAWIEENLPALPPQLGGGDTKTISRGIRWASVTVTQKPKVMADVAIRCTDASQAKALLEVITNGLAFVKERAAGDPQVTEVAKQLTDLKPKLEGETITMRLDPKVLLLGVISARVQPTVPPPAGAQPAKPDDGGL